MKGDRPDYHCLIVGAGFSGIGAAITLDREGFGDYLIVEAGNEVGGTWYWNTYPGIAVDIPSPSYQYSFEQRPDWSRTYARGAELKAYAEHCTDKYGHPAEDPVQHHRACRRVRRRAVALAGRARPG